MENKITGSNQGESSNEWKGTKKPYLGDWGTQNREGVESGLSDTAGRGATPKPYAGPSGNDGINGTTSGENLSAKYKYPNVSDDQGAGANQYE